jgi:hypothetical protein
MPLEILRVSRNYGVVTRKLELTHTRLSPVVQIDVEIPVIGQGIGGENPIGRVLSQTKLASELHSLNRDVDPHT